MEFGLSIPNRGPMATPEAIKALAAKAEESGFVRLAIPDHIVIPKSYASRYPYDVSGKLAGDWGDCMEQLILMTHVAAVTKKARILSAVMVVPHRPAVFTAKAVATMDVLSGGRIDLGVGAGWLREEFEAIGAPDFDARGRVTGEYLEAFKTLWTAEAPSMTGEFAAFDGIAFDPKPVQRPHPPIWTGGESGPALRRAARHADVWFPIGANPRHPLDTPARFAAGVAGMRAAGGEDRPRPGGDRARLLGQLVPGRPLAAERRGRPLSPDGLGRAGGRGRGRTPRDRCDALHVQLPPPDPGRDLRRHRPLPRKRHGPAPAVTAPLEPAALEDVRFNEAGLVPAVAQAHDTGEVLMMAWMNRESLAETLRTGRACYWSRSRRAFWRKGDTSGHIQCVRECRLDCDGDTILLLVEQTGPACHTGARSCFFRRLGEEEGAPA